ncbi:hypothetical protein Tco_0718143 [Tanacetum coccineum]
MIGSLLYLKESRPDIMFSVCLCACFQEAPKTSHLEAVKDLNYVRSLFHFVKFECLLEINEQERVFTDRWRLEELAYGIPSDGPYQTNPPSIEDIISSIRIDQEG